MIKRLYFEQIHPFVRYARFLELNRDMVYPPFMPYDCRLFYSYKGNGEILINDKVYEMPKGSVILFQSSTPYHLISNNLVTFLVLNFDFTYEHFEKSQPIPPETLDNFLKNNILENIDFIDLPAFNSPVYLNDMKVIESNIMEIEYEFRNKKRYFNTKASAILQDILLKIARRTTICNVSDDKQNIKIDEIIEYIQNNYSHNLSNNEVGRIFNFHPNYINSLMVTHTGLSLHQYVISRRISKAIELLESTNLPINEIAYSVGFKDICHFSRYFKKSTGRKPRDFRRMS